jgi:hypothetical protein
VPLPPESLHKPHYENSAIKQSGKRCFLTCGCEWVGSPAHAQQHMTDPKLAAILGR